MQQNETNFINYEALQKKAIEKGKAGDDLDMLSEFIDLGGSIEHLQPPKDYKYH